MLGYCLSFQNWIGNLTVTTAKTAIKRKLVCFMKFLSAEFLPPDLAWNAVVMCGLVLLIATLYVEYGA